jgi:hypothetical protein
MPGLESQDWNARIWLLGQDFQDRADRHGFQDRTARTGMPGQDRQDWNARTELRQPRQDIQNYTGRTGQPERNRQIETARRGQGEHEFRHEGRKYP